MHFLGAETGSALAARYGRADLVVGNNVYAHVPDLVDFTAGLAALVKPSGLVTLEFPHLQRLIERNQYDTIYHEHYQYLTLLTAQRALATADLIVVDVDELSTHGGSLRVHARPAAAAGEPSANVKAVLDAEAAVDLHTLEGHRGFQHAVFGVKRDLVGFLTRRSCRRASASLATELRVRATPCSTTAAFAVTCSSTRSTAARTSRECSFRAPTSRSTIPTASPKTDRTTYSFSPGTCARRSASSFRTSGTGVAGSSSRSPPWRWSEQ